MVTPTAIPFSEPPWLRGLPSPYYTASHRAWQKRCRAFLEENLINHALDWERAEFVPENVFRKFADANMLIPSLPAPLPVDWLKRVGIHDIQGVKVEEWDYIHTAIFCDEVGVSSGLAGPPSSLMTGMAYGVPPLLKFGSKQLQHRFLPDLLLGKKRTCIAITEPEAGSDVANIQTTAIKSDDGKHYIVNGTKKWYANSPLNPTHQHYVRYEAHHQITKKNISNKTKLTLSPTYRITNGIWADHACTAVRTNGPGPSGLSLLLIPLKNQPGVSTRRIHIGGAHSSGTTFITLDDVHVPISNLIGTEGQGMKYIMTNFNHERLTIAIGATRQARVALSSAFEYCMRREAFDKTLMDQPVVRHRLAKAGAELESMSAWIEQFVFQMTQLKKQDADTELGGLTALAKAQAGRVLDECARCAVLLFGGNGYTRTGRGEVVERIYREVPLARVPGGSEDVLLDLAVRQLVKNYRNASKLLERPRGSSKL
ncbi:MAG: hypothetical protein M1836_003311 [Candelina mexicana]|nr:MAG: hypothetical protein M1836_003311 [Candelina mexicana]